MLQAFTSDAEYCDIVNTLDAQRLCLELATNICCSPGQLHKFFDTNVAVIVGYFTLDNSTVKVHFASNACRTALSGPRPLL